MRMLSSCFLPAVQIILVLSLLTNISLLLTTSSTNETDHLALLAFKDQISADPLGALSSWNHSLHYCQWNGVKCGGRHPGRVTVLDLTSQKLVGTLSPYIGNLTFLRSLFLSNNKFHGTIPQEVEKLFRLQVLYLDNNSFIGNIPTNLSHVADLRKLYLIGNKLIGGIPVELTTLSRLTELALGNNELKGSIPPSLGNLSFLIDLSLPGSGLVRSIPDDLCRARGLKYFDVQFNHLIGMLPVCFYNLSQMLILATGGNQLEGSLPPDIDLRLPNLQGLYFGTNNFSGPVPLSLSNVSKLSFIDLSHNQFTGPMPKDLGKLPNLTSLSISSNHLGSRSGNDLEFINSLTNCSNLKWLMGDDNSFNGLLPNSVANLSTKMTFLLFGFNQIHGSIPAGIENLFNLLWLDFPFNNLTGEIPKSIGMLSQVHRIYLNDNRFSGQIPDSFSNLTLLETLNLARNGLYGSIPTSLGDCMNLNVLNLSYNNLNGTIPKQVIGLSSIKYIVDLSNNALSGSLPSEVGNMNNLEELIVSRNRLSGSIPDALGKCLTLVGLYMDSNFFKGSIPQSLSSLKGLQALDLSHNKLVGRIPQFFKNFTLLTYMNLSYNELEGSLPKGGVFSNASAISVVGNSKLCGGVAELKLPPCQVNKKGKPLFRNIVLTVISGLVCLVLLMCFIFTCYRRRISKEKPSSPSLLGHQFTRISYAELLKATNSFRVDNLIGVGSYGFVYKGVLSHGDTVIAVKVFDLQQRGASRSFLLECNAMRNLRHRNLLKIITCCSSVDFQGNDFKALIFEFMPNRSLEEWLHHNSESSEQYRIRNLSFLERLDVAIDVASALDYLHNHCQPAIVHCDLKPSNVLLDADMTTHVADFGLAKISPDYSYNSSQSQGSSLAIKGSIGYVAPEYGVGGEISKEGDVYSYGILLLEMITGKRPTDEMFRDGQNLHSFAKTALSLQVMNIVDPSMISEDIDEAIKLSNQSDRRVRMQVCLVSAIKLGVTCSAESPIERMNMGEIIIALYHIRDHHQGA